MFVNEVLGWRTKHQRERERHTVAVARRLEELAAEEAGHVVLAGDFDSVPDSANLRFLKGLQSLDGASVCYRDAWETIHPREPGHTFTTTNPNVAGNRALHQVVDRRIDYILVRADELGPTLTIEDCRLAFDRPHGAVWASDHFGVVADLAAVTA
jgi:endonuclease/exonuclease/phosphatase family metal-dependent hydrolase